MGKFTCSLIAAHPWRASLVKLHVCRAGQNVSSSTRYIRIAKSLLFCPLQLSILSNRIHVDLIADVEMTPTSSTDWIVELKPL